MSILFENHFKLPQDNYFGTIDPVHPDNKDCKCSYCFGRSRLHWGLNIPKDKAWNSWWVIKFKKGVYLRFTIPLLKRYEKFKHKRLR